jgi:hypothetical protein
MAYTNAEIWWQQGAGSSLVTFETVGGFLLNLSSQPNHWTCQSTRGRWMLCIHQQCAHHQHCEVCYCFLWAYKQVYCTHQRRNQQAHWRRSVPLVVCTNCPHEMEATIWKLSNSSVNKEKDSFKEKTGTYNNKKGRSRYGIWYLLGKRMASQTST